MASTSEEYVTMQGFGVPVSASGQREKAGSQASSSNDCSSSIVGNLATGEYTVTRCKLSVKTIRTTSLSKQKPAKTAASLSSEKLERRKEKRKLYMRNYRAKESKKAREARLQQARQHAADSRASESEHARQARLQQVRQHTAEMRASESVQAREARLQQVRQHTAEMRASESEHARQARLQQMRQHTTEMRASESEHARQVRLQKSQQRNDESRRLSRTSLTSFRQTINIFCDKICEICTKRCYQHQISKWSLDTKSAPYLLKELKQKNCLVVCNRCKTHLNSKKNIAPSKSYWNNLDPGSIPDVIAELSQAEQRLISRIIPFVKIIKLSGVFGQYSFKGQAVLFAQDVFEVTENLPKMLPRSTKNAGIVVVTERLENINVTRQFSVSRQKVYNALSWLVANNPLYKDVIIDQNVVLSDNDIIRLEEVVQEVAEETIEEPTEGSSAYMSISDCARIVRASWHQGDDSVFASRYAGAQCCAMALSNILRSSILTPQHWSTNILNLNMITGDQIYSEVRFQTEQNLSAYPIENDGYLQVRNFNVIKDDLFAFGKRFEITFDDEPSIFGSLNDNYNVANLGSTLRQGLEDLFVVYNAGILITGGQSFGVMHYDGKYYFSNSHSCGQKGSKANSSNGKACIIECDNLEEFVRICKRATGSRNVQYTLDYIAVEAFDIEDPVVTETQQNNATLPTGSEMITSQQSVISQTIPLQTSVMAPIDVMQPNVEDELQFSRNLNEITRKTKDNIVNVGHELKAEELAWYFLFPYGKNGLKEQRSVSITALDYFQFRILGSDTRFQRNDYLFYALSFFEYYRIKSTISACGKKIVNQEGAIEDVHLYVKNLRGSAAYWRSALNELLAQIRCLGTPTYFVTFSSNDLNWLDQRKALLIADGRPDVDPSTLDIYETQKLIEKYPVVLSRHFMVRVNALMRFIKNNDNVFGGKVKDHWWRIEFQNRGSPHLHMVVWIENHPEFDSEEGKLLLDRNCCCKLPTEEEDPELDDLVKKCQIHHHTHTCTKNNTSERCRFNFPRQQCNETRIVSHSSDDFLRNGGRICLLKRRKEDAWVNNYHPELLRLWTGNMDIQPCGSNEAIAYYIAKYISKAEPECVDSGIAQAIQQIQREETDISRKLFRICMKILHERQVSAAECAYRLCHIPLRDSSRSCIFLNTRKPEQRYRVLQFDKSGHATGYYSNIFERYEKRPLEHPDYNFANMSLTEFAMLFEPFYQKKVNDTEESVDHDAYEENPNTRRQLITLLDKSKMGVRNVPAVVRVPYFIAASDPENFFYSLLIQYMPYRSETELLDGFDNAKEAFLGREDHLKQMSNHMRQFRERDQQLENVFNQVHAFEILEQPEIVNPEDEEDEELPETEMSNDQFQRAQQAMNVDQRQLFIFVTDCIKNQLNGDVKREKIFVTGGAGSGKTFLLKLLKNQVNRCYGKSVVKIGALTGVAARLVGGTTLHRLLKLPVQKDGAIVSMPLLTGNYLRTMRLLWQHVEFLFIDEISMVPYEMLCMIDSRLRQLKSPDACFGGINVLLFGDLMQLPPVRGHQVFQQPEHMKPAIHLWRQFRLVELKQNMRQQGDTTFIDVLNALRVGELKSEHLEVLLGKVSADTTGEFSIEKALRIYPTNVQVAGHNEKVLQSFEDKGTKIYTIKAQDQLIDATRNLGNTDLNSIIPSDINKTGGLPSVLKIFVGAKVMLRSNIDVSKGLVNGNMGLITEIIWPNFRRDQVYAEDIPSVRIDFGPDGVHVITPISIQFPAKYSYGTAERRMLPLILSWASTVHKMQGCTVEHAVIYLGHRLFAAGQAYVALSRCKSLDGIRIEELDCSKLTGKTPCNSEALDEMNRLRGNNL